MTDTAMITMVAGLLGSANAFAGWLIHLARGRITVLNADRLADHAG
ncbi:hypothetical protein QFZ82_007434 [Streptomyces sp. V4I23]|nr:hypothetical protein [Streptomyces sp. V4I23]MDQ1012949.1 hypothetical protein [Streptomyces sp. V4I23]